jgi:4'-phosphopantetheinyl transferase
LNPTHDIHVTWMLSEDAAPAVLDESASWLDESERERLGRFAREPDGRAFLLGRWLARRALAARTQTDPSAWTFRLGAHGKPFGWGPVQSDAPAFNLSHGGGLVVCASCGNSETGLGIDVESVDRNLPGRRLERFLTSSELLALGPSSSPEHARRFWRTWTAKEAALKAAGTGVAGTLAAAEIELGAAGDARVSPGLPLARLRLFELPLAPSHCVALAVDAPAAAAIRVASTIREPAPGA